MCTTDFSKLLYLLLSLIKKNRFKNWKGRVALKLFPWWRHLLIDDDIQNILEIWLSSITCKFFENCPNISIKSHIHFQFVHNNCTRFEECQPKGVILVDCTNLGTLLKDAHLLGIHHSISRMHFVQPDQILSGKTDKPQPLREGNTLHKSNHYCKAVYRRLCHHPHRQLLRFWVLRINKKLLGKSVHPPFSCWLHVRQWHILSLLSASHYQWSEFKIYSL
jgi:hypothetical protein